MTARGLTRWWDGSPAQPVADFSSIEARLGFALPEDFKDILRVFGLGGFGELHLFHPGSRVGMLRLPEATTDAHALFQRVQEFRDESFPPSPSAECAILGMLLPRTYLIWKQANGWRLFDSEMSRSTSVGDDLRSGLDRLFREWLARDSADKSSIASAIWGEFSGDKNRFFSPAKSRA